MVEISFDPQDVEQGCPIVRDFAVVFDPTFARVTGKLFT